MRLLTSDLRWRLPLGIYDSNSWFAGLRPDDVLGSAPVFRASMALTVHLRAAALGRYSWCSRFRHREGLSSARRGGPPTRSRGLSGNAIARSPLRRTLYWPAA